MNIHRNTNTHRLIGAIAVPLKRLVVFLVSAFSLIVVYAGTGAGPFNSPTGTAAAVPVHGDFNGDGVADVIIQPGIESLAVGMHLYANEARRGQMDHQWPSSQHGLRWDASNSTISVGDFDGNGRDDLLVQSNDSDFSAVLLSDRNGRFPQIDAELSESLTLVTTQQSEYSIVVLDVNGDGTDDILFQPRGGQGDVSIATFADDANIDNTNSWSSKELNYDWRAAATDVRTGQFSGQSATGDFAEDLLLITRENGRRTRVAIVALDESLSPVLLSDKVVDIDFDQIARYEIGDLDNDGLEDVLLVGKDGTVLAALQSRAGGELQERDAAWIRDHLPADSAPEASPQSADAENSRSKNPVNLRAPTHNEAGVLPGEFSVANGAANYSIPIMVPPGRNGMAPNLSFEYNSRFANGYMGTGWKIGGLSTVERCIASVARDTESRPIDWTLDDRLCLDGKRLVLSSGEQGAHLSEYKTELDEFARITLFNNSTSNTSYFRYEDREGRILFYGNESGTSPSTTIEAAGRSTPLVWALSKVLDRHDNYMDFSYTEINVNGVYYPKQIRYSLPNTDQIRYVRFEFESPTRPDFVQTFVSGSRRTIYTRLKEINTFVGSQQVRRYTPVYGSSQASGRSLVEFLQVCGYDTSNTGWDCLPATEFTYVDDATSFTELPGGFPNVGSDYIAKVPPADMNGDGIMDLIRLYDGNVRIWYGNTNGFDAPVVKDYGDFGISDIARISERSRMDWNHDGRQDFTFPMSSLAADVPPPPTGLFASGLSHPNFDTDEDGNFLVDWPNVSWPDPVTYKVRREKSPGSVQVYTDPPGSQSFLNQTNLSDSTYTYQVASCNADLACSAYSDPITVFVAGGGQCDPFCSAPPVVDSRSSSATSELAILWFDENDDAQVLPTGLSIDIDADYPSYYVMDVNGDGREDIVTRTNGQWKINLRTNFSASGIEFLTTGSAVSVDNDVAAQVIDYNGDGRFDLLLERPSVVGAARYHRVLQSEGNYFSVIDNALLASTIDSQSASLVTRPLLADINGDGLTDAVTNNANNSQLVYRPNTGNGWQVINGAHVPGVNAADGTYLSFAVRVMDVDGDGDLDMLRPTVAAAGTNTSNGVQLTDAYHWEVIPFEGNQFKYAQRYAFTNTSGAGLILGNWTYVDIYGDGSIDILALKAGDSYVDPTDRASAFTVQRGRSDALNSVTNGLGKTRTISYAPLNDSSVYNETSASLVGEPVVFPEQRLKGSFSVVSQVTETHGGVPLSGNFNTTNYRYANARVHRQGRGFLGFERIVVEDTDAGLASETLYHLSFPLTGKAKRTTSYILGDNPDSGDFSEQTNNTWSQRVTHSLTTSNVMCNWEDFPPPVYLCTETGATSVPVSRMIFASSIVSVSKEPNAGYATTGTRTESSTFDNYGNVLTRDVSVDDTHTTKTVSVTNTPAVNLSTWWVNRISSSTSVDSLTQKTAPLATGLGWSGNTHSVSRTVNQVHYGTGASGCGGSHREICTITVEPGSSSLEKTLRFEYDNYGNGTKYTTSTTATGIAGFPTRSTSMSFAGGGHYFWSSMTNAESQTMSAVTDRRYGQIESTTGINGVVASYQYDALGRLEEVAKTGLATKYIDYLECGVSATCPPYARYKTQSTAAQRPTIDRYFDENGRAIKESRQGFADGAVIHQSVVYDHLGRLTSATEPYTGDTPSFESTFGLFDGLHRPQSHVLPTGETRTFTYGALETTSVKNAPGWSGGLVSTTQRFNALGWLQSVRDAENGNSDYRYDSQGNLVVTRDALNKISRVGFDKLGRRVQLDDPDRGEWSFIYDALGQQREVTKVKPGSASDKIIYQYDLLGRVLSKSEKIGAAATQLVGTWLYDVNPHSAGDSFAGDPDIYYRGALSKETGAGRSSGYQKLFAYDNLGRLKRSRSRFNVGGAANDFDMSYQYDSLGRVDQITYPTGYGVKFAYNARGYLTNENSLESGSPALREITGYTVRDQIAAQAFGPTGSVSGQYDYTASLGLAERMAINCSGVGCDASTLQDLNYVYDGFSNLVSREKVTQGTTEFFTSYDRLFRLKESNVVVGANSPVPTSYTYLANGNLTKKSDFATSLSYAQSGNAGPHAVTSANLEAGGTLNYGYDLHGNMTSVTAVGADDIHERTIEYSLANLPTVITGSNASGDITEVIAYGPGDARWKKTSTETASSSSITSYYIDDAYELVENRAADGRLVIEKRHHVGNYLVHTETDFPDSDGDGVADNLDNCYLTPNPNQIDANNDGFGNYCDFDLNDDNIVNFIDLSLFSDAFLSNDPVADINSDGSVNFLDYASFSAAFGNPPGPGVMSGFGSGDSYLLTDNLGSVDTVVTEQGEVLARHGYTAFGSRTGANWVSEAPTAGEPGFATPVAFATSAGFTGHEDLNSGLIHMNGRVFDPNIGRFTSADPMLDGFGNGQGLNPYSYLHNNPLAGTDSTGFAADQVPCPDLTCVLIQIAIDRIVKEIEDLIIDAIVDFLFGKDDEPEQVAARYDVSRVAPNQYVGNHPSSGAHSTGGANQNSSQREESSGSGVDNSREGSQGSEQVREIVLSDGTVITFNTGTETTYASDSYTPQRKDGKVESLRNPNSGAFDAQTECAKTVCGAVSPVKKVTDRAIINFSNHIIPGVPVGDISELLYQRNSGQISQEEFREGVGGLLLDKAKGKLKGKFLEGLPDEIGILDDARGVYDDVIEVTREIDRSNQ